MSRAVTLGNGRLLVALDSHGLVRDLYFPHVGLENHVGGHFVHRIGVWVGNTASWLNDGTWEIAVRSGHETLSGSIAAINQSLGVSLVFKDVVYNEDTIFLRKIIVTNLSDSEREIKVYFAHEFELYESHSAHTAYFDPISESIIHYRNQRVFLIHARIEGERFSDYTTGIFGYGGMEGSYRDAENGTLSKNPIEHGSADSVIGVYESYAGGEEKTVHYWMCVATSIEKARALNEHVQTKTPQHFLQTTEDYWRAWVNRQNFSFYGLSEEIITLFKRSLLTIRAHADDNGAIIASTDSDMLQRGKDTYSYMWPRDGALSAFALYRAGSFNSAKRFFQFCDGIVSPEGYFMHKYSADGSLGSSWHPWIRDGKPILPIQEDETALVILTLWRYYEHSKDLEFVEMVYNNLIKRCGDFLVSYRDEKTKLPLPSYDLWEEKYGIHTFTASVVYAALNACGHFADLLGKSDSRDIYLTAASETRKAILEHLYDADLGIFRKMVTIQGDAMLNDNTIDVSSVYGIFAFGVLPLSDKRVERAYRETLKGLSVPGSIGGIARYEGDNYQRAGNGTPGNPWIIATLWMAEYYILTAKKERDLEPAKEWLSWTVHHAQSSGSLSEQLDPQSGEQISASPLTWSHGVFVSTVIAYLDKLEDLGVCVACNPVT